MKNLSHNFTLPELKQVTVIRSVSFTLSNMPSRVTDDDLRRAGEKLAADFRGRLEMQARFRCYVALDPYLFDFVQHRRRRA